MDGGAARGTLTPERHTGILRGATQRRGSTMAIFFVAVIPPEHYDSFKKVLNQNLPDSFDVWSFRHSERIATRTGKGQTIYEVKVSPDEFKRFCDATNSVHNLQSLDRFATEKAGGKHY